VPPEQLFELRRRTFDTPHFRGIEFIEAEAKTIINRVPGNFLPFKWTINPYRGCSHSCTYCATGDTPILMGDGRIRPLSDLQLGDSIYGTVREGRYRRFVKTHVLAHWSTVKSAYRVIVEDGTELVCSGDHRFLTGRGWKHVTGAEQGSLRRPHLTVNNELLGTGHFAAPPDGSQSFRRGYLCGMIRGDGHLKSYVVTRKSGAPDVLHQFRLALVDIEAVRRSREYLASFEIDTNEFLFQKAAGERRALYAIRANGRGKLIAIDDIVRWPSLPTVEWTKGFLAGIFDAEGSYSCGTLRICNTDAEIVERTASALRELGFSFRRETTTGRNGLTYLRLLGGVCEAIRFFHLVDPAITRKRSIEGQAIKNKAKLRVVAIEPLGIDLPMYDITTGTGDFIANGVVSHNCFARVTHTYMDMNAGRDFESKIVVKINAPTLLRKELSAKRWQAEPIAMGTATDPYQRAEGRYQLMPQIIRLLTEYHNAFSILTKGTLILRDLDLLVEAANVAEVGTALSIGTLDDEVWRRSEPGTPHPRKRMDAVRRLNDSGIPCGVMVAPILPEISDRPDQLMDVVKAAVDAGATHITPILLHLRPVVREEYMAWLNDAYPGLVGRYEDLYKDNAYGPKEARKALGRRVSGLVRAAGGTRESERAPRRFSRPKSEPAKSAPARQLQLL
jgi:DNA repair photolyase